MDSHRRNLNLLLLLYLRRKRRLRRLNEERRRNRRRWWVCPTISRRVEQGAWDHLVQELRLDEPDKFINFHRMTLEQFDWLLGNIEPVIQRRTVVREPIPAGLKLSLTLRFLSSGDSMISLSYVYRIGKSTTSSVISETCSAIWNALQPEFLATPTREGWEKIAADFYELWNFPNCVGAIDGKHVVVQNFAKSGSAFYNYKGSFSTVLLACCDAHYCFTLISIGSAGRESDGGIFQSADLGQNIIRGRLPLPESRIYNGFNKPFPAVFVGDAAFPLLKNLMRPYGGANVPAAETIFNYRLSRARRVVENAFGVLAARFRIFRKPIIACDSTVDKIVQATCVLHNWLRKLDIEEGMGAQNQRYMPPHFVDTEENGVVRPGQWREDDMRNGGLLDVQRNTARNSTDVAKETRNNLRDFFMTVGAVPWQWSKLPNYQQAEYAPNFPPQL